ncbi:MAG: autotransporter assembly complex family protein [Lautropia sp.]
MREQPGAAPPVDRGSGIRPLTRLAGLLACASLLLVAGCGLLDRGRSDARGAGADAEPGEVPAKRAAGGANYAFEIDAPRALAKDIREKTLVGRWRERADYDPLQFDGLVARLDDEVRGILRNAGYFAAQVKVDASPGRVGVVVEPGEQATVSSLDLALDGPARDDRAIRTIFADHWTLSKGDAFTVDRWQSDKQAVIDALQRRGYLRARVADSDARVDTGAASVALTARFASGDRIAFGDVVVDGLQRYGRELIDAQRPFSKGEPYSLEQLAEFETRLRRSGYFSSVSVLADLQRLRDDPATREIPIEVIVTELERRRVVLGLGFSTDEGPRGQVGFEHRDLFGREIQLQSAIVASAKRQRAFANFRTPYDAEDRYVGFGQRIEREDIENVETLASNSYLGLGRRNGDIESFTSVQFQFERESISAGGGVPVARDSKRALVLGHAWDLTRFDSRLDPTRGYGLSLQVSGAHEAVASTRSFARLLARATRFQPLGRSTGFAEHILVGRAQLGIVAASARDGIPTENLFRAGGVDSIRGYGYQTLGLQRGGATLGARYLAIASLEYQRWFTERYGGVVFVDYGNAADSRETFDPVAGYGIGARYRSPIGPIKVDLAYGDAVSRLRLHFSIGYVF